MRPPTATKRKIQNLKRRHGTSEVSLRPAQPETLLPPHLVPELRQMDMEVCLRQMDLLECSHTC